ncbi:prolipoprotein diacylglyceryl transferase [Fusibacter sp. JL298sf-3]
MLPTVHILGHTIASYGLIILIGIFVGALVALVFSRKAGLTREDCLFAYIYGVLGILIGGKILYLFVEAPRIWAARRVFIEHPEEFLHLMTGGFVFYGSLIGGTFALIWYAKRYKLSIERMLYCFVPIFPLVHGIGRLGCFSAGCCYGIAYDGPLSVTFEKSLIAPSAIPLFPVQLVESGLNFALFIALVYAMNRVRDGYKLLALYAMSYAIMRFTLEFFRGDLVRGHLWLFSTSQWISLAVFAIAAVFWAKRKADTSAH